MLEAGFLCYVTRCPILECCSCTSLCVIGEWLLWVRLGMYWSADTGDIWGWCTGHVRVSQAVYYRCWLVKYCQAFLFVFICCPLLLVSLGSIQVLLNLIINKKYAYHKSNWIQQKLALDFCWIWYLRSTLSTVNALDYSINVLTYAFLTSNLFVFRVQLAVCWSHECKEWTNISSSPKLQWRPWI